MYVFTPNTLIESSKVNANFQETASEIDLIQGAGYATVLTDQSTTSTSFADLATAGPAVTVTIGASGKALIVIQVGTYNVADLKIIGVAITGATTAVANDIEAIREDSATYGQRNFTFLKTGLNAGSTTFTLKYRTNSGTARFYNRHLSVIPL